MNLPVPIGVSLVALLVALVVGVLAGRAGQRFLLLIGGILVAIVIGAVVVATGGGPAMSDRPAWLGAVLPVTVPLLVAFLAGWLCARGSWFSRIAVLVVAAIVLAAFPYNAVAAAIVHA